MGRAFQLEVADDRVATVTFDLPDRRVNIFNRAVLEELSALIGELAGRADIGCLVLVSGKADIFIAGADVDEIARVTDPAEAEAASRGGQQVFAAWEALPFPTVAAIRGTCVGGGTELALASTYILMSARPELRVGLPEVKLGILPGWGGCTRMPRRIGIAGALDLILSGRLVRGKQALKLGLADALLPDPTFAEETRRFALEHRDQLRREASGTWKELLLEKNPLGRKLVFDQARKQTLAKTHGHYPAPLRALEVVRIGVEQGPQRGFEAEARAIGELATSPVSKNLVHVFKLMEAAKKPLPEEQGVPPARMVAVLGAGIMGGGIAQLISEQADIPVRLKDIQEGALASGMAHAAALFDKQVQRRRLDRPTARRKMTLIRPTLDYSGFERADVVIEAVIEKLEVKQQVFADVARQLRPEAVLASNTSSLSVDAIAGDTPNPERVAGMHFFNPVDKMPLVEVVVGRRSAPAAVGAVAALARRLGKTPLRVADAPGFLVNRLLMFYMTESLWLLREGHAIEDIDRGMRSWGMPLGPFELSDEVGLDVGAKVAHILGEAFGDRLELPAGLDAMTAAGRLGAKTELGFYRYEKRKRVAPDPAAYEIVGVRPVVRNPDPGYLADRMVLPMVNEAARCLAERVVASAGELDLAMILGTGFPPFRGGLCRWVDSVGPRQTLTALERLASTVGRRFEASPAFREVVDRGGFYAAYPSR